MKGLIEIPHDSPILAWHFVRDGKLRDRRPVVPGKWVERWKNANTGRWVKTLRMCGLGLHASCAPLDALQYASGYDVCLVECAGFAIGQGDKLVCTARRPLWMANAEKTLRNFARCCARDVLHTWRPPQVVVDYLETGSEHLRAAAGAAARAAALAAAGDAAAWAAAWAAAGAAARAAAWAAAWDAALAAAGDAAGDAAWAAARAAQNTRLHNMLMELAPNG